MSGSAPEEGLIVFLRFPILGQVKTRLASSLGAEQALSIYNQLVERTLDLVRQSNRPIFLFYTGGLPLPEERSPAAQYFYQQEGDLGVRMVGAIDQVLTSCAKAVVIGSDCPGLTSRIIDQAFEVLDQQDIVLGPAKDGGYYLVGCKKVIPEIFETIAWSSSTVLQDTLRQIHSKHLSFTLLPMLQDVDTSTDWEEVKKEFELD